MTISSNSARAFWSPHSGLVSVTVLRLGWALFWSCAVAVGSVVGTRVCVPPSPGAHGWVRGSWQQQWDWAVLEWNRDNVFEHPALRSLPDGDLSGVRLSYEEERTNCEAIDSTAYDPIGWKCLRIWEGNRSLPQTVALRPHATP